jgi:hypothetical protein
MAAVAILAYLVVRMSGATKKAESGENIELAP